MPTYSLELELFSVLNASTTDFQIRADGTLLTGYSPIVSSSGSTISISISYGGTLPTSLLFRFSDTATGSPDQIEIRSVKINDRFVNTENYLSSATLNHADNASINIVGDDRIAGGAGNDYIRTGAGDDIVSGGNGNDTIHGDAGNDALYGGVGQDKIRGGSGDDEIHGGDGSDNLVGNADNDTITGGAGSDKISGGSGDDILFGDGGDDTIVGGSGNDTIDGGGNNDLVYGGSGDDTINGGNAVDTLIGGTGNDTIHGDGGADILYGQVDNDTLYGGSGDDTIYAGEGIDTVDGGAGNDQILSGSDVLNQITKLGDGTHNLLLNGTSYDFHVDYDGTDHWLLVGRGREGWEFDTNGQGTLANMTVGLGTSAAFAPVAYDDAFVNEIIAASGADLTDVEMRLKRAANIDGSAYQEVRRTSVSETDFTFDIDNTGTNFAVEYRVLDSILGASFTDTTSLVRDTLSTPGSDSGNNYQRVWNWGWGGKGGIAGFSYGSAIQGVNNDDPNSFLWERTTENHATPYTEFYIRLETPTASLTGSAGIDTIDGGAGNDTIIEDDGDDVLSGGTGNDTIAGGNGSDTLNGNAGNDSLYGGDGTDTLVGGDQIRIIPSAGNIVTYGGSQDNGTGTVSYLDDNVGIEFDGNRWKQILGDFEITANTVLEFDFRSTIEAEVSGIGFDTDNGITDSRTFEIFGTQNWGIQAFNNYDTHTLGDWVHYEIDVGSFYTGNFTRLIFANDDDGNSPVNGVNGNAFFRNIVIHEGDEGDNILSGGEGVDNLYGDSGLDTFLFEDTGSTDIIHYFNTQDGDILDVSDVLDTFESSSTITDYVQITNSGDHAILSVDADGGANSFVTIGELRGMADLDVATLYADGNLIAS